MLSAHTVEKNTTARSGPSVLIVMMRGVEPTPKNHPCGGRRSSVMVFKNEMIILDGEIKNAIPTEAPRVAGINYCEGWHDFKGMEVSVICAHLVRAGTTHVFLDDNLDDLAYMIGKCQWVAGFNSIKFDEPLLEACWGIKIPGKKSFDFKREIVKAAGLDPMVRHHAGFSLERCCGANTGALKNGHGALAPIWWQQGKRGRVIDYCLGDVSMLTGLFRMMATNPNGSPNFKSPVDGRYLTVDLPFTDLQAAR